MSRPSVQAAAAWQFPTPTVMRLDSGLTARLADLVGEPDYGRRAAGVGELIRVEDGLGVGVRILESLAG